MDIHDTPLRNQCFTCLERIKLVWLWTEQLNSLCPCSNTGRGGRDASTHAGEDVPQIADVAECSYHHATTPRRTQPKSIQVLKSVVALMTRDETTHR